MVGLAEAEAITGTMQPMLQDSAESREWHLAKGQGGTPLICLESLRKSQANDGIVRRKISGGGTL